MPTRRAFLVGGVLGAAAVASAASTAPRLAEAAPARTILDEERERTARLQAEAAEERRVALRRGFDAVDKARLQLDELDAMLDEAGDAPGRWEEVKTAARRYNNDVNREGMGPIAKGLTFDKERALKLCVGLRDELVALNRLARKRDSVGSHAAIDRARSVMTEFGTLRP
jgi:hypothetical protein